MISVLFILISCLVLVMASATEQMREVAPGKAAIWGFGMQNHAGKPTVYNTKSSNFESVSQSIKEASDASEITLVLRSAGHQDLQLHDDALAALSKSVHATDVMPYIYRTELRAGEVELPLHQHIANMNFMKGSQKISLEEVHSHIMKSIDSKEGALFNRSPDVFEAALSGNSALDAARLSELSRIAEQQGKRVSVVAIQEPGALAFPPKAEARFGRVLAESAVGTSSNIADGIYYKPSGAEFSIYYANTYLYITPDIFTGIMTGLFVSFVVYTGLSRMGMIQGGSSFPSRKIDNGKEF